MSNLIAKVHEYHQASKHHPDRYARGPGYMDWASQPFPFRRYEGSPLIPLERIPPDDDSPYDLPFSEHVVPAAPFNLQGLSRLLFDSLALSAWKRAGTQTWALRVNPSSGNLHPTEGYLICGPLSALDESPVVCHYAPKEHALELRTKLPMALWGEFTAGMPEETAFIGLTSIHWREAWKYGERAYRYCALDIGHALGAISIAAAGMGWGASLVESLGSKELAHLIGVFDMVGPEREEVDCLVAVGPLTPQRSVHLTLNPRFIEVLAEISRYGKPNRLSQSHREWTAIDRVSENAQKPPTTVLYESLAAKRPRAAPPNRPISLRRIIRQRRSAVAMDGITSIPRSAFYRLLSRTTAAPWLIPFSILPWPPHVHLAIFVHRVDGLVPGLYFLVRNEPKKAELKQNMHERFLWEKPEGCPEDLHFYLLKEGDVRKLAMQISCFQDIAAEGCFSVAMIAEFEGPLEHYGAWFYPRLFWECGAIGQMLYLEAEAVGLRGTGIGCFFDDPTHELLGLKNLRYQDLYHFTVGGPVEDPRITSHPAYSQTDP